MALRKILPLIEKHIQGVLLPEQYQICTSFIVHCFTNDHLKQYGEFVTIRTKRVSVRAVCIL